MHQIEYLVRTSDAPQDLLCGCGEWKRRARKEGEGGKGMDDEEYEQR